MKTFVTAAGLAIGATAAVLPRQDQCCFSLTASGGQSGQVGQLSDGQNRIGGSYPAGQYCLSGSSITDGEGRGCILTPPTTQLQCDEGATPDSGFSVSGSGELQHDGDSTFYACAAANGEYNIYTETSDDQTQCSKITLTTSGECSGSGNGGGASSESASQPAGSAAPSAPAYSAPGSSPAAPESSAPAPSSGAPPAYSAPGSSPAGPESTAPAPSAPGYSAPAPSAPAPSAPAPSAPAPSAPVPSAPAESAPAPGISTRIVTQYTTICGCSEGASGPPSSAPGVPAPSETYPAPGQSSPEVPAPSGSAPGPTGPPEQSSPQGVPSQTYPMPGESSAPAPPGSAPAPTGSAPVPSESAPAPSETAPAPTGTPAESSPGAPPQTYPVPGQSSAETPAPSESAPAPSGPPAESYPVPGQSSAETPAPSQPATGTQPAPSAGTGTATGSGSTCATTLEKGSYETPHLIVPVNSQSPDQSYGTSYNAYANGQNSTVFNFDIPQSDEGKTCTLVFLFPKKEDLETTDYTFNGQGSLDFAQLSGAVDEQTSYSSCPSKAKDLGSVTPQPGGSYVVQSGACAAGTTETIEMSAAGGLELEFFEDWNPSPLGLFITVC